MVVASESSREAEAEPASELTEDEFAKAKAEDWAALQAGVLRRRGGGGPEGGDAAEEEEDEDPLYTERRKRRAAEDDDDGPLCSRTCALVCGTIVLTILLLAGAAYAHWRFPSPLGCSIATVRPQKFKIDVTDFFAPHVTAAVELVLSVRNANLLRTLLLDGITLSVYEAGTGLKLGSATKGSLMITKMSNTQVTLSVTRLGSSLPPPQQQRLATEFLRHKALLLTFVVAATSRLPIKGSKPTETTSNTTRRVDFSGLYKDPFFQRVVAPPPPPSEDAPPVHDVPI